MASDSSTAAPKATSDLKYEWPLTYEEACRLLHPRISSLLAQPPKFQRFRSSNSEQGASTTTNLHPTQLEGIFRGILKDVQTSPYKQNPFLCFDEDDDRRLAWKEPSLETLLLAALGVQGRKLEVDPPQEDRQANWWQQHLLAEGFNDPSLKLSDEVRKDLRAKIQDPAIDWDAAPDTASPACLEKLREAVAALSSALPREIADTPSLLGVWPNDGKKDSSKKVTCRRIIAVLIAVKMAEMWTGKFGTEGEEFPSGVPLLGNREIDAATAAVYFGRPDFPLIRRELMGMNVVASHEHLFYPRRVREFEVKSEAVNQILKEVQESQ